MKLQQFIDVRRKVYHETKTAGVKSKFSEKEPTKIVGMTQFLKHLTWFH